MYQVLNALVNGHDAADGEHGHSDHKRPEIEDLAMTEGMSFVRGLAAQSHSPQQQNAVTGIDCGMETLGQHRAAPGQGSRGPLRNQNCDD